ncbi:uncharacterized protein tbata [Girardinichthys multiradiatus]|uniref:uncharacterized protein tbata n=1 Tax=Girardinichthys multiradiatus TaxID=208333 RepID=UPI001FADB5BA|nr:uncharacterized protein tbata [Girardinichthys multiradiatus]
MSRAQRQNSRETTGDRSSSLSNQVLFTSEFSKMLTKSTPHFSCFSQHSFFSRHNPDPHRVRHIQAHTKQTNLTPMNNQIGLEALKSLKSMQEAMVSPRILQSNSKRMHKISYFLISKHGMVIYISLFLQCHTE